MTTVALAPAALSTRSTWYRSGSVIGIVGAVATWGTWTSWYSLAIIAVTLPSAWLGTRILQLRQSPALS
jgi:hypothetical protein